MPGAVFRTDSEPFKVKKCLNGICSAVYSAFLHFFCYVVCRCFACLFEKVVSLSQSHMKSFTTLIVDLMKKENLFSSQGGPIILAQASAHDIIS